MGNLCCQQVRHRKRVIGREARSTPPRILLSPLTLRSRATNPHLATGASGRSSFRFPDRGMLDVTV